MMAMMSLYGIVATTDARNAHHLPKCHTPGSSPGLHVVTWSRPCRKHPWQSGFRVNNGPLRCSVRG